MPTIDTTKATAPAESDAMTPAQWDAYWVTDWLASEAYNSPPPPSADPDLDYAHENPDAWPLIELPAKLDGAAAWLLLESAAELDQAMPAPRFNPYHGKGGKFASKGAGGGGGGTAVMDRPHVKPITAAEARGNSRPVSAEEFQHIAGQGKDMLDERLRNKAPIKGLDDHWDSVKESSYAEVQKSWGGATVNAHTGVALPQGADKYALSIKPDGVHTVSVHEKASRQEFDAAMDTAKSRFRPQLENEGSHLGIFHDDENHRIDIDPVVVVGSLHEVEGIGAYTHAIGGAYHFKSGDGFWPPHVAEGGGRSRSIGLGDDVTWLGPGQWHSYADAVQHGAVNGRAARDLYDRLQQPDGGFTYGLRSGRDAKRGYAVAAFPGRSKQIPLKELTPADIQSYVDENRDLLSRDGHMLGGWHDPETGQVWLDISLVANTRAKAMRLAQQHHQVAIFDLGSAGSVPTE